MGCCFSKYKPNKTCSIDECDNMMVHVQVQDKLVTSLEGKKTPNILPLKKISPSPPSPPSSASSISSFTCTNSNSTTESCSSISSGAASSVLSLKDRSFSNEFLWSCVKENPHIIRINSIKEASRGLTTAKLQAQKLDSPVKSLVATLKQSVPHRINGSTPQKRVRLRSPTPAVRQKSIRKDPEREISSYNLPSRGLISPSPSRRFLTYTTKESCSKRMVGSNVNAANNFVSYSLRKENLGPASPSNNNSGGLTICLRNRETLSHRTGSKIDEVAVAEALAQQNTDPIPMEDIDNPLVSLDCFIFL